MFCEAEVKDIDSKLLQFVYTQVEHHKGLKEKIESERVRTPPVLPRREQDVKPLGPQEGSQIVAPKRIPVWASVNLDRTFFEGFNVFRAR